MANNRQLLKAIGLMSGTSLDGIDAAVITTDGENITEFGEFVTIPYTEEFRARLRKALDEGRAWKQGTNLEILSDKELEHDLTVLHAKAVKMLGVKADLIGFHGQTIIHRPKEGFTWQMGDGELLAKMTGMDVVNDFRMADIRAGGQGAPLVPIFHKAITQNVKKPVAIVNIGGVANITWIADNDELMAFDTGPGNAMINDITRRYFGKEFDEDGEIATHGNVNEEVLAQYLMDDYFYTKPPKSLDRNHFTLDRVKDLKPADAIATLTAFTSLTILMSNYYFISSNDRPAAKFYITGGGRHNKRIMKTLGDRAEPIEAIGHNGDAFEAQAFAYLAARVKYGLPISFPTTTGCKESPLKDIARYHKK